MQLEMEIKQLLDEHGDPTRVADELIKKWASGRLSWKEQQVASRFLLNAGFHSSLLQQVIRIAKTGDRIPWGAFAEALGLSGVKLKRSDVDQILLGAGEQEALEELVTSRALDSADSRFGAIREKLSKALNVEIPKIERRRSPIELLEIKIHEVSPEVQSEMDRIGKLLLKKAKKSPELAAEISVALQLMGIGESALAVVELVPDQKKRKWLRLELLLENSRFIDAMDLASELEEESSSEPDLALSAAYSRAVALGGLGKTREASFILEEILTVEPEFRSAHSLLLKWGKEAE